MPTEFVVNFVAGVLTLAVLSRIVADNPVFRFAQYLFVGVSLGYGFVVLFQQVLLPNIFAVAGNITNPLMLIGGLVPFILGAFLLPRALGQPIGSSAANIPLSIIFAVGVAVTLAGALSGTLVPQLLATIPQPGGSPFALVSAAVLVIGVIATLSYFYFTVPRAARATRLLSIGSRLGYWWLMVTLGFFFAGALITYLTALTERFESLRALVPL